jgi:uncharacterized protein (TIGR00375 family)
MTQYYADLHIHSRYSRATSKSLTLRKLAAWGGVKGLQVVATGDFTHPGWLEEIETTLRQDGDGLLSLKDPEGIENEVGWLEGSGIVEPSRFMLCTEISSIYKRGGQVRKIHNLVFLPDLDAVRRFNTRLSHIGNLQSDGRPILGLDSRDLLEMVLETHEEAFLVPAHIWTPWFSLFGSKSGFNSLEECFGDLSGEIFALETGLSSDPEMNWRWSALDHCRLISNSDAHSGEKLAREANIFSGECSFAAMKEALKSGSGAAAFLGTVEFFPEEGKYHLDGHRKCGVMIDPRQNGSTVCPVCGQPLTVGVLNRVLALADRSRPEQPERSPGYVSLIPLPEVLSEILGVGPKTKTVSGMYRQLVHRFGSELSILERAPLDAVKRLSSPLAEALRRMRRREVYREPGFDGQYGRIAAFTPKERSELRHGKRLSLAEPSSSAAGEATASRQANPAPRPPSDADEPPAVAGFNPQQIEAIKAGPEPALVLAGPGTGKTKTLLGRVEHHIARGVKARRILVVTFTRAAARELRERLLEALGPDQALPRTDTLHALGFDEWVQTHRQTPVLASDEEAKLAFAEANPDCPRKELDSLWSRFCLARETQRLDASWRELAASYFEYKASLNLVDYTDLLEAWLEQLRSHPGTGPYTHVLVDEVQDLSPLQVELLARLVPESGENVFAIGDPRQSIYGFRGALGDIARDLAARWPDLRTISLQHSYRSKQDLLDLAAPLFPDAPKLEAQSKGSGETVFYQAGSAEQEAHWIAEQARGLIGGTGHLEADQYGSRGLAPGDVAVLVRFKGLIPVLEKRLHEQGVPCSVPETSPFWEDERIRIILNTAARFLGLAFDTSEERLQCSEHVLAKGPSSIAASYEDVPPFDRLFWQSKPFQELKKRYAEHGGWTGLLNWINLERDLAQVEAKAQKVRIMTLHAAKGLEFEAVFLPALEQGILPFAGLRFLSGDPSPDGSRPDEEEEKRIFYVGLTRAKSKLYLSLAGKRKVYGRTYQLPPSRFLEELSWEGVRKLRSVTRTVRREKRMRLL